MLSVRNGSYDFEVAILRRYFFCYLLDIWRRYIILIVDFEFLARFTLIIQKVSLILLLVKDIKIPFFNPHHMRGVPHKTGLIEILYSRSITHIDRRHGR